MGFLHRLLRLNVTDHPAETTCQPDAGTEDPLFVQLRESRAYRAELNAELDAVLARIQELGRRYPYTS